MEGCSWDAHRLHSLQPGLQPGILGLQAGAVLLRAGPRKGLAGGGVRGWVSLWALMGSPAHIASIPAVLGSARGLVGQGNLLHAILGLHHEPCMHCAACAWLGSCVWAPLEGYGAPRRQGGGGSCGGWRQIKASSPPALDGLKGSRLRMCARTMVHRFVSRLPLHAAYLLTSVCCACNDYTHMDQFAQRHMPAVCLACKRIMHPARSSGHATAALAEQTLVSCVPCPALLLLGSLPSQRWCLSSAVLYIT